jgi:Flp pilus assembly protein TadD
LTNSLYLSKAARFYEQAVKVEPDHAGGKRGLELIALLRKLNQDREPTLRKLVELQPNDAHAHSQLGQLLLQTGRKEEALTHLREALRLEPKLSYAMRTYGRANDLAWVLATDPDASKLNPKEAVQFATQACEVTQYAIPTIMDTLAAAYAADGDFKQAIAITERAIAQTHEKSRSRQSLKDHLKLYQSGQRVIDPGLK